MYIPKKLKLNRFRVVQIPSGREIYNRFGACLGQQFSGDTEVPPPMTKTDSAAVCERMAREDVEDSNS